MRDSKEFPYFMKDGRNHQDMLAIKNEDYRSAPQHISVGET